MGTGAVKGHQQNLTTIDEMPVIHPVFSFTNTSGLMSCENCKSSFNIFRRKRICSDCKRYFCASCLIKSIPENGSLRQCQGCLLLASGHSNHNQLMQFKIKDLRLYIGRKNIPMFNCTEKNDLVDLILAFQGNEEYFNKQEEHSKHVAQLTKKRLQEEAIHHQISQNTTIDNPSTSNNDSTVLPSSNDLSSTSSDTVAVSESTDTVTVMRSNTTNTPHSDEPQLSERLRQRQQAEMIDSEARRNRFAEDEETETRPAKKRATLNDIAVETDIDTLTVQQLKEILATNFVDYKGCVEKRELIDRVQRLWGTDQANKKAADSGTGDQDGACNICMDAAIDCVLLECGHMVTCSKCGKRLSECPICRQYVVRVVHVFKS